MSDTTGPVVVPTASVRFVPAGRRRTFLLPELSLDGPLEPGDRVVVRDGESVAVGTVVAEPSSIAQRRTGDVSATEDRRVLRRLTEEDSTRRLRQQYTEQQAFTFCQHRVRERGLDMKLTRVEHAFDGAKLLFYYTAEHCVDFRELVRDLAAAFHIRI